ncbi:Transglutaminase-like superfamily protein [Seinonella peptonophila]|uniref:Transglutaminase-like superfamily protein n=1 Tax=Seinonella peptonophila TaxID=112248 RepID=A0A1M4VD80_9BACL|nr:lasso peptide biosynthesis protein [Seinonella peptonophila]SHE66873.1 Transglutaminase-like superfamily protein [Seinonella peptonophila]
MDYYQSMMTGSSENISTSKLTLLQLFKVIYSTVISIIKYHNVGAIKLMHQETKVMRKQSYEDYLFARKITTLTFAILNIFRKDKALCIERASVLCYVLRNLNIEAQVVIGSKSAMNSTLDFPYHAWVEAFGIPVSDPSGVKNHFNELHRFPKMAGD